MSERTVRVSIDGVPEFDGNDDLDCPYLGYVRVVPADGYIDVPIAFVALLPQSAEDAVPGLSCTCGHAELSHDKDWGSIQPCNFPGCGCTRWRQEDVATGDVA